MAAGQAVKGEDMIARRRLMAQMVSAFGCGALVSPLLAPPLLAQSVEEGEAERRKARSLAILRVERVPLSIRLPPIITASVSKRRPYARVVQRCVALAVVAVKGETGDHAIGQALTKQFSAIDFFSPAERAFMDDPKPDEVERNRFAWRYEGAHVMLWALGLQETLGRPVRLVDARALATRMGELGVVGVLRDGKLRPQAELLDAADLHHRYQWAVDDAEREELGPPAGLVAQVIAERCLALNWLIDPERRDWDAMIPVT